MTMKLSDDEWRQRLTPEQYHVLRERGTELPGTGTLLQNEKTGDYACVACGNVLFKSGAKYESTMPGLIGWPSFSDAASEGAIELRQDNSAGMKRTEVVCAHCDSHLGHLFDDPSSPNGQHFCINSVALDFRASDALDAPTDTKK